MVRHPGAFTALHILGKGEVLGLLGRGQAESAYRLYQDRRVEKILWTGEALEASLNGPRCTVQVQDASGDDVPSSECSQCGSGRPLCIHAAAALFRWIDVRPTMRRKGPGTVWRGNSRQPFLTLPRSAEDRIDLSHLTGADLRAALELQLSLHRAGSAVGRLANGSVEIRVTLPSGGIRVVGFAGAVLPYALPLLKALPRLRLEGELAELELADTRLHPVLEAHWNSEGILLAPGYSLPDGTFLPLEQIQQRLFGRWAQVDHHLCRLLDPDTPLVPFLRQGRRLLEGREALRFLTLDHRSLTRHAWYRPAGALASFRQPLLPTLKALHAELTRGGKVLLRPVFAVGDDELDWPAVLRLVQDGFGRHGEAILRAPDLIAFERVGFRATEKRPERGLVGDRLAFIRLTAETGVPVVSGAPSLKELADTLRGAVRVEIPDPPGLRSQLRPYQRDGTAWLWSRYRAGVGALLADDMGLGKTHQVMGLLCLVLAERPDGRFLVVCPRGVLEHWYNLLTTFAPDLPVVVYHGPRRTLEDPAPGTVVLTTYDIVVRSHKELSAQRWEVAVYDEAQRIKNPRTKAARSARRVKAAFRVALSGTPLENRLLELWSVVDLILPGYLGSERDFRSRYRNPSPSRLQRLRGRLSVITLRRLKEQVLEELPDKLEDVRFCRLTTTQEELYRRIHQEGTALLAEQLGDPSVTLPYVHIFALLTRLKQVCDHPSLVPDGAPPAAASGKLVVLDELLEEALGTEQQVVVFSQYVEMIRLLERHLKRSGIEHLTLIGSTRDRGRVVRRFNGGQHERVLLASLLAGGVGIDLTGASVVIHYDRWWNPAKENQATDRVHRIGQRRFVQVFKLVTRETIEERIAAIIEHKMQLMDEVVAPTEDVLHSLDRKDLAAILGLGGDA